MSYQPRQIRNGIYKLQEGLSTKNLILIHGLMGDHSFGKGDDHMAALYEYLEADGAISDYTVWTLKYDTIFCPFDLSGRWLAEDLNTLTDYDFSNSIIVGFSMGGLIARTMLCNNFNFKYLITIDTPHHGPTPQLNWLGIPLLQTIIGARLGIWGTFLIQGIPSLAMGSCSQLAILSNELDIAKRKTSYACYGIDYRNDAQSNFDGGDWVVSNHSQMGLLLGDVRWRYTWKKTYCEPGEVPDYKGIGKPHSVASKPELCQEAIKLLTLLLEGNEMPERQLDGPEPKEHHETFSASTEKSPIDIRDLSAWYCLTYKGNIQLYLQATFENQSTKPLQIDINHVLQTRFGDLQFNDGSTNLMLPPKKSISKNIKKEIEYSELLPETLEIFANGELKKIPLYFVPIPIDEKLSVPSESIWSLEGTNMKATYSYDEEKTYYRLDGSWANNSSLVYSLSNSFITIIIDDNEEPIDPDSDSDIYSWLGGSKALTIKPNSTTAFSLHFTTYGKNIPHSMSIRVGSSLMPTFEEKIIFEGI
jgi:pimeloyl-ACP methyl ester carboxylesterase